MYRCPSSSPLPAARLTNSVIACRIIEQGANYRRWQKIVRTTDAQGHSFLTTNRDIVELATGLNYRDPVTGQWQPAKEEIDPAPGGAIAPFGQHQVSFANNLNAANALVVQMSNGQTLQSGILGLSYSDTASGRSVMIAEIKDCQGQIVGSNQVLYTDAFNGLSANVRYTYTKAGLEQDVILLKQPPAPEAFGLSSATTVLQVLTEFSAAPQPQIRTNPAAVSTGSLPDESLDFGPMRLIHGKAFLLGTNSPAAAVSKQWVNVNGRAILVESVRLGAIQKSLAQLPQTSRADEKPTTGSVLYAVSTERLLPARRIAAASPGEMALAKTMPAGKGLVLDYVEVNGNLNNYTFASGTTYFVSGPVYCGGTTTIEGGAVIKYPDDRTAFIDIGGDLNCQTGPYQPAIFTAADDSSVGEGVNDCSPWCGHGSIQPGGYADPALEFDGNAYSHSLHDVRICYAQEAIQVTSGANADFSNLQIVNCETGIDDLWDEGVNSQVTLNNCLIVSPDTNHTGNIAFAGGTGGTQFQLQSCTVDNFAALTGTGGDGSGPGSLDGENSIFTDLGDFGGGNLSGNYNGFWNTPGYFGGGAIMDEDSTSPYIQIGGGAYYLTNNSTMTYEYANAQPVDYSQQTINQDTTLGPAWSFDYGFGYTYPQIDYVFSQTTLGAGVHLTIQPGVVVAWQGQGLTCAGYTTVIFDGTVANPCFFLPCNDVQETGGGTGLTDVNGSDQPQVYGTFTRFYDAGGQSWFFDSTSPNVTLDNCQFWGGQMGGAITGNSIDHGLNLTLQNCLLENSSLSILGLASSYMSSTLQMQNCTWRDGTLRMYDLNNQVSASVYDSAFDGTTINLAGNYAFDQDAYNAYLSGASRLPHDANDVIVSSFNWQTGPLGDSYLPSDSPLIDAGGQPANSLYVQTGYNGNAANLANLTTQTTGAGDSGNVDIGCHYPTLVAADGSFQMCPDTVNSPQSQPLYFSSYGRWNHCNYDLWGLPVNYLVTTGQTSHGTLQKGAWDGCEYEYTYTPNNPPCYEGQDSFTYRMSDGLLTSLPATITANVGNPNPNCQEVMVAENTGANQPVSIPLSGFDVCGGGCNSVMTLGVTPIPPPNGTLGTLGAVTQPTSTSPTQGSVLYTPPVNYIGPDEFQFTVAFGSNVSFPIAVTVNVVPAPSLIVSPRPYHLALDWTVPASVPNTLGGGFITGFNIYRCGPGSGACTPSTLIATVPANQNSYADTNVQSGQTYCYAVTYLHSDSCTTSESPISNLACGQICTNACPQPEILITGNNYGNSDQGNGPIETYDFVDGSLVHSFIPQSAAYHYGRGLAIYQAATVTNIYYTELFENPSHGSTSIHVCPYGTEGSGGLDEVSQAIPNPDQRVDANGNSAGIAALALHYDPNTQKTELYALTGYGLTTNADGTTNWPEVWEIDPDTGQTINVNGTAYRYISIHTPLDPVAQTYASSDGFTVLSNGDFLINDYDGADHCTTYREYSGTTGALVPPPPSGNGLQIDLSKPQYGSLSDCTGVAIAPDGSFYIMANDSSLLVHVDSSGNFINSQAEAGSHAVEDIDVQLIQ